jgi:DNA-binding NtrC family response regulator
VAVADAWGSSQSRLDDVEARSIRALAESLPTIMITARSWAAGTSAAALGLTCILEKPVDVGRLLDVVEHNVDASGSDSLARCGQWQ